MQNENSNDNNLSKFIDDVCAQSHLRVEKDLGDGFVKLRSDEAERRQAAQDIRSVEDAVIEMLRNSRDADAKNIFVATAKSESVREVIVIDDGCGVPENLTHAIFDARVTSKLDSFHEDRWGVHGRGMALFSIAQNSLEARVIDSRQGQGTSIYTKFDTSKLSEKKDQSTFPSFILGEEGRVVIRGPHNILRTATEFALEHRDSLNVYVASPSEIASALYFYGCSTVTSASRLFSENPCDVSIVKRLAYSLTPDDFANTALCIGLKISERGARRILNDEIEAPLPLCDIVRTQMTSQSVSAKQNEKQSRAKQTKRSRNNSTEDKFCARQSHIAQNVHLSKDDEQFMSREVRKAYAKIAKAYYLNEDVEVSVNMSKGQMSITVPLIEQA